MRETIISINASSGKMKIIKKSLDSQKPMTAIVSTTYGDDEVN